MLCEMIRWPGSQIARILKPKCSFGHLQLLSVQINRRVPSGPCSNRFRLNIILIDGLFVVAKVDRSMRKVGLIQERPSTRESFEETATVDFVRLITGGSYADARYIVTVSEEDESGDW